MKHKRLLILFFIIDLLIVMFLGVNFAIYNQVASVKPHCEARPEDENNTPDNFARVDFDTTPYLITDPYDSVYFPSRDASLNISAWYIPNVENTPARTVILVHGVDDCKQRAYTLTAASMLHQNGFNVLLMDMRDHGESDIEDGRHAAGTEEYLDVLGAWDWLIDKKGAEPESIGIMGFSLGAATSIIATSEEPQVAAVWSDSSFADINDIIGDELERSNVPRFMAKPSTLMGQVISGDDFTSKSPLEAVTKLNGRPIFIVHGTADERINVKYATDLTSAINANGGDVEPWMVEGAQHIEAIWAEPALYEEKLVNFFNESLSVPEAGETVEE